VAAGDVEIVSFVVFCDPTGEIAVSTTTTGADLDPDGYLLAVDGMEAPGIGVNAELVLTSFDPGVHAVTLSGVASNCAVQGGATRSVTVAARETAHADLQVVCAAIP